MRIGRERSEFGGLKNFYVRKTYARNIRNRTFMTIVCGDSRTLPKIPQEWWEEGIRLSQSDHCTLTCTLTTRPLFQISITRDARCQPAANTGMHACTHIYYWEVHAWCTLGTPLHADATAFFLQWARHGFFNRIINFVFASQSESNHS